MVAAREAESEMEDAKEKVRVRSSTTTKVADSLKELGDQIARLMVTLNRVEQGTHPVTTPNSPRGHGRGQMDRSTPVCPSSHNGQTGLGQNTSNCSSSAAGRVTTASLARGSTQAPTGAKGNAQNAKDFSALQCFRCQGWGHMTRECATPSKLLNKGMWSNPPHHVVNKLATFPPWPLSKTNPYEGSKEEGMAASFPNSIPQSRPHSMSYREL